MKSILFMACLCVCIHVYAQTPKLNSFLQAEATIFLNFEGDYVTGTAWNWNGPVNAQPAGLSPAAVSEIFDRVAEDYRPFRINITTDPAVYAAAPYNRRTEVIVTPTSGWYGSAGGVSLVGSFSWGDGTPAWVFSALLYNNPKNIAEACSHEAGHTLGLQHQSTYSGCSKTEEYNSGRGNGEIGWAPIMGVGYSRNLTTWHTGPSAAGCNVIQNDMEVITGAVNGIGYRDDDWPDTSPEATQVRMLSQGFQVGGLINQMNDVDVFKIKMQQPSRLKLQAVPQNVGSGNDGANIDIRVSVLDAAADTVGTYNPSTLLDAGIDTALQAGDYYIAVRGTGNMNHSAYGSLGAYVLAGTLLNVLPVQQFRLTGHAENGQHALAWSFTADEPVQQLVLECSGDGSVFAPLFAGQGSQRTYTYPAGNRTWFYRVKAVALGGALYYSNVLRLSGEIQVRISVVSAIIGQQLVLNTAASFRYELFDGSGKLLAKGRTAPGLNRVETGGAAPGLLVLRCTDGSDVWTQKLIKR